MLNITIQKVCLWYMIVLSGCIQQYKDGSFTTIINYRYTNMYTNELQKYQQRFFSYKYK